VKGLEKKVCKTKEKDILREMFKKHIKTHPTTVQKNKKKLEVLFILYQEKRKRKKKVHLTMEKSVGESTSCEKEK
jgi:hypothetical protein